MARHQGLYKHESSLLTQIRTGKIGLRAFLFERGVPSIATLQCRCSSRAPETVVHLVLDCPELEGPCYILRQQQYPRALSIYQDFVETTARLQRVPSVVR